MFIGGLLAAPLFILTLFGLVRFFSPESTGNSDAKKTQTLGYTGWEAVSVVLFIFFAAQFLGYWVASRIAALQHTSSDWLQRSAAGQFLLILLIEALTLGMLFWFLRRRHTTWSALGIKGRPRITDVGYVLIGYLIYIAAYLILVSLIKAIIPSLDVNQAQEIGFDQARGMQLVLVFISLVVLPPITEEILMRGFVFTGLKRAIPQYWAILVTSLLFAAAHLQFGSDAPLLWVAAIDTFVLSLILIQLRERTGGRLWASMGLHALKNGIAFVGLFVLHLSR